MSKANNLKGFGLKLDPIHHQEILSSNPNIDWFEILSENYLVPGGRLNYELEQIGERYPLAMHGVSLSLGSSDPLNYDYLKQLKQLANKLKPKIISDHLCWTGVDKINTHDLLPLPYTEETITHVASRIKEVQDYLGQQILIENVSSYLSYTQSAMSEWEFLSSVADRADCLILLDVNNIYVSSFNHKFDAVEYISEVPAHRIAQIHLAGHTNYGDYIIDTHDAPIIDQVWDLYAATMGKIGLRPTLIERDANIPPLNELVTELDKARKIATIATKS